MIKFLSSGHRLEKPEHCPVDVYNLMQECWKHEPMLRPKFEEIRNRLPQILNEETKKRNVEAVERSRETYETLLQTNPGYAPRSPQPQESSSGPHRYALLCHASSFPDILDVDNDET